MNVIDAFDENAERRPEHPCLVWEGITLTYVQVQVLSRRVANGLRASGFEPGHKAAVLSPNHPLALVSILSILRAGLVWLPLNPRNALEDNARTLAAFGCDVLLVQKDFADQVASLRAEVPGIRFSLCIDDAFEGLESWAERFSPEFEPLALPPEHLALLSATGGTTGRSKGVMHSIANVDAFTAAHQAMHDRDTEPVYLATAPITHAGGRICLSILRQGGTIVVLTRPDPAEILRAIERHRVTRLLALPTMIYSMLAQPDVRAFDYTSLKYLMYGGAPMSTDKLRLAIEVFGPVMSGAYGQTEAPLAIAQLAPEDHFEQGMRGGTVAGDERLSSCGRPTRFAQVRIVDDEDRPLPAGTPGEIALRGPIVMQGYYRDPEATAESSRGGWHHTGDIGYFDHEGFLHLVDRKKDMIITGGFNVYPAEVENVILGLPGVQDCAVVGAPDEKWGEVVTAVVQLVHGCTLTPEQVIAATRPRLGGVKTPKSVEIWPDLPRSAAGKVLRRVVRSHFWAGQNRSI
jgi:fatty-acyl-CoA synthase